MYKGRTLTQLATELQRQADAKMDFRSPTKLMELSVQTPKQASASLDDVIEATIARPLQFRLADKFSGRITELTHDQFGKWAGIPSKYYDRMRNEAPALLAANVNHWFRNAQGNEAQRLVRTLDGNIRAFLSSRYRMLDNWDIANAVLPILVEESKKLGGIEVVSSDVTEKRLYIKAMSNRLTYEVKKGDIVQVGICVSNSEVGKGKISVEPFLFRLVCTNGAILNDTAIRKFHLGRQNDELEAAEQVFRDETRAADDKAFMMKLQDVVRASFDDVNFAKLKGITIDATTRKITAPIQDVVEEVANRYQMTEKNKDSFLKNLIEGGDTSQWGLANAVTQVANTAKNYEEATELEKIGGEILALSVDMWEGMNAAA